MPAPERSDIFNVIDDLARRVDRLERAPAAPAKRIPWQLDLLGQQPLAAEALSCPVGTTYDEPGNALNGHAMIVMAGINVKVANAFVRIIWTPNSASCGVRLVKWDQGPVNVEQIAEITGNAAATPVHTNIPFTAALQAIFDFIAGGTPSQTHPQTAPAKSIGYQTKGSGSVGPLLYSVQVIAELEF